MWDIETSKKYIMYTYNETGWQRVGIISALVVVV